MGINTSKRIVISLAFSLAVLPACAPTPVSAPDPAATSRINVTSVTGFNGPEAVRYDPSLDVFFVSNFNGASSGDANGFVSRVSAYGEILDLKFMQGTPRWPLHGARGMYITAEGLWVADAGGVHLFDRKSGRQIDFVDFSAFDPGFINDIVQAADGALYVTDTGNASVYRIVDRTVTLATKTGLKPNGITVNPENGRLLLAPWEGPLEIVEWDINDQSFHTVAALNGGGNYDGIEVVRGNIIIAGQKDTSLHIIKNGRDQKRIELPGEPADIGIDTRRNRIAVPFVSLNRIDIFSLDGRL